MVMMEENRVLRGGTIQGVSNTGRGSVLGDKR